MNENTQEGTMSGVPQEPEITLGLKVTVIEINTILAALDEMPHKMSRKLIDNLIQQAQSQLQQPA